MQCARIDTAGERSARRRNREVVRSCKSCERVEQNHDVFAHFDKTFCAFEQHFGSLCVMLGKFVKRRIHHFALYGALHIRDFLGAFVDEKHFEFDVGIVGCDGACNHFQKRRLTGFRR